MAKTTLDALFEEIGWEDGASTPPRFNGTLGQRIKWGGSAGEEKPQSIPIQQNPRFQVPGPEEPLQMNYLGASHLRELLDQIAAEEALPPHKKNAAKIASLKQEVLKLSQRMESRWVEREADKRVPRLG